MTLFEVRKLFPDWTGEDDISFDRRVSSICFDSRKLQIDCVFVAIRGEKSDGHKFLGEAARNGAIGIVCDDPTGIPQMYKGTVIRVKNTREALNRLASHFYGQPAEKLFCVGVTGTNGKTTVSNMVEAILTKIGKPTGVIGTIDHHLGGKIWKSEMTTPDPVSFQSRLAEFLDRGAKALSMEVSSHALSQSRVDEVSFDVALFTNLSRDHLDYHKDMEDYFDAKKKLFTELLRRSTKPEPTAVVNVDDEYGKRLKALPGVRVWSYGMGEDCNLRFEVLEQGFAGTRFRLRGPDRRMHHFHIRMPGLHNVYNAVCAVGAGLAAGASLEDCASALETLGGVKGRLESVQNRSDLHIFVDYAHTDGAIETVLKYLRGIRDSAGLKNKIITVFGCGGDRDKGKRPLMMKAAEEGSDLVILTSDNPRTEDPNQIIKDALAGAKPESVGRTVFTEPDRREGIRRAIEIASPGDVILIAGKGHEDYQQIGTTKHPFSDVEVVKEILK